MQKKIRFNPISVISSHRIFQLLFFILNTNTINKNYNQMSKNSSQQTTRTIGHYQFNIQDVLGKGYSSTVYRGRDTKNGQLVAVKAINRDPQNKAFLDSMIKLEIQSLKQMINKPKILQLIDVKQTKNRTYIITNYCQGGTLKQFIDKKGKITEQEALEYFKQIIIGYESIIQAKILHRDLKPANILMERNNNIQIGDFGFAIPIDQFAQQDTLIIGSPMYMPYEALKKRQYTQKGDIWALGITLFELINGSAPFRAKNQKELANLINRINIQKIIPKSFSPTATKLLTRILQHHKQKRATLHEIKQFLFGPKSISQIVISRDPKLIQREKYRRSQTKSKSNEQSLGSKKTLSPKQQQSNANKSIISQNNSICKQKSLWSQNSQFQNQSDRYVPIEESAIRLDQDQLKKISAMLISQIHFCRFCYKLLRRMVKLFGQQAIQQNIIYMTIGLIFMKLTEIYDLVGIREMHAGQYKHTRYYEQIKGIIKQYSLRYINQLGQLMNKKYWEDYRIFERSLISEILRIFNIVKDVQNPDSKGELIIILDYLITLKQLLKILSVGKLQEFKDHSKIEKIVDGSPSQNITMDHIKAIKTKLKNMKLF